MNSPDDAIPLQSIRVDGQESIEQQLDIHVSDMLALEGPNPPVSITLKDLFAGIRYVMNYRIKGGKMPHLHLDLCKRLCKALLQRMNVVSGGLLIGKKPTDEANEAFVLFGEFMEEVAEFRQAVGDVCRVQELKINLLLHVRLMSPSVQEEFRDDSSAEEWRIHESALAILSMLVTYFPHFSDWKDLIKPQYHNTFEPIINDLLQHLGPSAMNISSGKISTVKEPSADPNRPVSNLKRNSSLFLRLAKKMPPVDQRRVVWPPPMLHTGRDALKVCNMYGCDPERGLSSENQVYPLREYYGFNEVPSGRPVTFLQMLWSQMSDPMILVLLIVAVFAVVVKSEEYPSTIFLLVVVIMNVTIGIIEERKAKKALDALAKLSVPTAKVIRDGNRTLLPSRELVPGDLVELEEGDAVPADLRLIQCSGNGATSLEIMEAMLTGESVAVSKSPAPVLRSRCNIINPGTSNSPTMESPNNNKASAIASLNTSMSNMNTKADRATTGPLPIGECTGNAFMATLVVRGRGLGVVVRTGRDTAIGKISAAIVQATDSLTPIQKKLKKLGIILVALAIFLCAVVAVIGLARGKAWRPTVLSAVVLAVSVIPEGLVAIVTVTMALAVSRMAKQNAIVRKLPSVETLGSVTVICSDKTGTLTEGKMAVTQLWTSDGSCFTLEKGSVIRTMPVKHASGKPLSPEMTRPIIHWTHAMSISYLCNNASFSVEQQQEDEYMGDPTEIALLKIARDLPEYHFPLEKLSSIRRLHEIAFDSDRKMMTIVADPSGKGLFKKETGNNGTNNYECNSFVASSLFPPEIQSSASPHWIVCCKGAPESVLPRCSGFLDESGQLAPMTDTFLAEISKENDRMGDLGLRVLALAVRVIAARQERLTATSDVVVGSQEDALESQLTFIGLVGMIDPPRKTVKESIENCKSAGIKVIMITGDHLKTATAIASNLGIYDTSDPNLSRGMRGIELDTLSLDALKALSPFPSVFARVSPENKLTIVTALQARGDIVAMTGDGINDAPAIKRADVGVAMGQAGTEITKQAADIVLSDDNFSTIVMAVEEGRRVFDNINKFIVYLLSCNSAEIWVVLVSVAFTGESPFEPINILWANIIADIPPSMSLGLEPTERDVMTRNPRDPTMGVVSPASIFYIIVMGFVISLVTLFVKFVRFEKAKDESAAYIRSETFAILTLTQFFLAFTCRSVRASIFITGFRDNIYMVWAILLSLAFLLMGHYVPGLNGFLELEPLKPIFFAKGAVCVVIVIICSEIVKITSKYFSLK